MASKNKCSEKNLNLTYNLELRETRDNSRKFNFPYDQMQFVKEVRKIHVELSLPSESLISETGGSFATCCLPLMRLVSTIGRLDSNCLLNPR